SSHILASEVNSRAKPGGQMTTTKESRVWLLLGLTTCVAGGVLLGEAFKISGVTAANASSLAMGLSASFAILAGVAALVTARVLHAVAVGYQHREAVLWRILAGISTGAGMVTVVKAHLDSQLALVTL